MYLLYNLGKYSVRVDDTTKLLEIDRSKSPMAYQEAAALARRDASADSENYFRGLPVQPRGTGSKEAPATRPRRSDPPR